MKHLYINAGHHNGDTGAIHGQFIERDLVNELRDLVVIEFEKYTNLDISIHVVPDNLNLSSSIFWINNLINNNGHSEDSIAIDIHFNANRNRNISGTEVYYYKEKKAASIISAQVAAAIVAKNRGAKPDRLSYVGSLGFVRNIDCPSVIIETAYITSMDMMRYDEDLAAQGIVRGVAEVLGLKLSEDESIVELQAKVTILTQIVETYRQLLALLISSKK